MTNRTGSGDLGAQNSSQRSALDAAIEAATEAVYGVAGCLAYRLEAEAAVRAAAPILRQAVADEIARRIELKRGERCPECGGKPAWTHHDTKTHQKTKGCGGGHAWPDRQEWHHPAGIAREVGRGDR